ncbi:Hydrogenase-3 nickel incorporation protein HypA [Bryocella elongata]|uniref:Hydrogenase maturation factor HypA n=1 Tax=Bryocella elongata TaxID=863522 RepID=A0A1H5S177_9BACT|nr:hydrogenase maturation nickel metallochaperone HypA [Bryocella elongata]SEF44339.1 Hydrogenase-3 nickel incorporation protein HypA [Bryocella elongata]
MHEISIAESIVQIAEAKAREQNAQSIQIIKLRLGTFTTIVPEALQFAFEIARQDTLSCNAQLDIEIVPMTMRCVVCDATMQPVCGLCLFCEQCGFPLKIISGEELQVEYIEVDSEKEEAPWNRRQDEFRSRPMY